MTGGTTLGSPVEPDVWKPAPPDPQPPRIYGWPDGWLYRRRVSRMAATGRARLALRRARIYREAALRDRVAKVALGGQWIVALHILGVAVMWVGLASPPVP